MLQAQWSRCESCKREYCFFGDGRVFTIYLATGDHTVRGVVQEYLILPLQEFALSHASMFYSMPVSTPCLHSLVEAAGPSPIPGLSEQVPFVPARQERCRHLSWAPTASQQHEHSLSRGTMPVLGKEWDMTSNSPWPHMQGWCLRPRLAPHFYLALGLFPL